MTDDGGQRAERNQKSEVGSRRSEDRGKKVGGWRQREDNCELRIANLEARRQKKLIALRKGVEIVD